MSGWTRRDHIEQRYALGDIPEEIAIRLGCSMTEVLRVGEAMDRAAKETPATYHPPKGRRAACKRGHPFTPENRTTGDECRTCKQDRDRAREQRERKAS